MKKPDHEMPPGIEEEAKNLYGSGNYQEAAKVFSRAANFYLENGDELRSAEMRNNQSVSLLQANQPEFALKVVLGTEETFYQAGDQLKQGMALANQASALQALGRHQEAIEKFSLAATIFNEIGQQEMFLQTKQSISGLKLRTKNIPGALISMQEGLEEIEKPNLRQRLLRSLLKIPQQMLDR
jgi:tetratricopeptide (TPR) repeat protein